MDRTAAARVIAAALRRERERHGISLTELARRAGIAKSTLSQLEAGTGNPSVETLWALAVVLDVPFSRLVDPPAAPVQVVRAGEGLAIQSERAPFSGTLLAACPPGARRDLHVIAAEPGPAREADATSPAPPSTCSSPPAGGAPGPSAARWSSARATTPASRATARTSTRPSPPARPPCW